MTHMLVKWVKEPKWDVYPLRNLVDIQLGLRLNDDASIVDAMCGKAFQVKWSDDEEPDDAFIIAVGHLKNMEKRRSHVIQMAVGGHYAASWKDAACSTTEEVKALKEENKDLKRRVQVLEDVKESAKMVKRLRRLTDRINSCEPATMEPTVKVVCIGPGVSVAEVTLVRLRAVNSSAAPFARSLLRTVFSPEELQGCSLYGAKSNAHKDLEPKPALDRCRVDAVIGYTCTVFPGTDASKIKHSLSTMLSRDK